ncbi:unnamed protein product [Leptidea sinapis]|uniref:Uncharacterized protein n=1 Tax=Leptidea sinapis TaxID=189913 RepID=A0A5E4QMC2_9NEOP|nr:unnamed protein product [Leptidea sinapis]
MNIDLSSPKFSVHLNLEHRQDRDTPREKKTSSARARGRAAASSRQARGSTSRCSSTATSTATARNAAAISSATCRGDTARPALGRRARGAGGAAPAATRPAPDQALASPPRTAHTRTRYSAPYSSSSSWYCDSFA